MSPARATEADLAFVHEGRAGCMPVHDVKPAGQRDTAGRELGVPGVTGGAAATAESAVVP